MHVAQDRHITQGDRLYPAKLGRMVEIIPAFGTLGKRLIGKKAVPIVKLMKTNIFGSPRVAFPPTPPP